MLRNPDRSEQNFDAEHPFDITRIGLLDEKTGSVINELKAFKNGGIAYMLRHCTCNLIQKDSTTLDFVGFDDYYKLTTQKFTELCTEYNFQTFLKTKQFKHGQSYDITAYPYKDIYQKMIEYSKQYQRESEKTTFTDLLFACLGVFIRMGSTRHVGPKFAPTTYILGRTIKAQ